MTTSSAALSRIEQLNERIQGLVAQQEALAEVLASARRELAQAQEERAREESNPGTPFFERWSRLLDSLQAHRDDNHYNELREALLAVPGRRMPALSTNSRIRRDNRQILLMLFTPSDTEAFDNVYHFLLALLPLLVNEANPKVEEQAGIIEVFSSNLSDKEDMRLVAHPRLGRFEVLLSSRFEESVVFKGNNLREALEFLRTEHAYT